jgi:plastocyanin
MHGQRRPPKKRCLGRRIRDHDMGGLAAINANDYYYHYFLEIHMRLLQMVLGAGVLALGLTAGIAAAQDAEFRVVIKDHKFVPAEIAVPAGKKIKLVVENQDATAEEFESYELNREKIVPAKGQISIFVGPLAPGRYPFFGDFHKDTAHGVLIAK